MGSPMWLVLPLDLFPLKPIKHLRYQPLGDYIGPVAVMRMRLGRLVLLLQLALGFINRRRSDRRIEAAFHAD